MNQHFARPRYNLPDHKVSNQLKTHSSFSMYPPLWSSRLVAMYDKIKNTSEPLGFFFPRSAVQKGCLHGEAKDKAEMFRERYTILKQV